MVAGLQPGDLDELVLPEEVREALVVLRRARAQARAQIERLIEFLDETDVFFDEIDVDRMFAERFGDDDFISDSDFEPDADPEPDCDDEPSLGATEQISQVRWGRTECPQEDLELDESDVESIGKIGAVKR